MPTERPRSTAARLKKQKKPKPRSASRAATPSSADQAASTGPTGDKKKPRRNPTSPEADAAGSVERPQDTTAPAASASRATKTEAPGRNDEREATYNGRKRGPATAIATPVDQVAAINGFMIDLDLKILASEVIGDEAAGSAEAFYKQHVAAWLDRDPVLKKAEVRDTGGGLHILLLLDEPVIVVPGQQRAWDGVARGLHGVLPGDPNLSGIIAMTRPVGALNTKYDPPREVRLLREGQPVTQREILDLLERTATTPARVWMNVLHGGERASPCPLCRGEGTSLGVAGGWQVQCYDCGRRDAAALIYRFYTPKFLTERKEVHHG